MTSQEKLQQAVARHKAGALVEAEGMYRQILTEDSANAQCHYLLATVLVETNRTDQAVHSYERAIELTPGFIAAHNNLGNTWRKLGRLDLAIACFKKVTELAPQFPQAHTNLATAYLATHQFDAALQCYRQALLIKPGMVDALVGIGTVLVEEEKFDEAIAIFRQAIEINPQSANAYCGLAAAQLKQNRLDDASISCETALRLNPELSEAHNNRGSIWRQKGDLENASKFFNRALAIKPDLLEAMNNLGALSLKKGDPEGAIAWFELALKKDAGFMQAVGNLGNALKDIGEIEQACACYRKCIKLTPTARDHHSNLIFTMNFDPQTTPEMLQSECRRWNDQHARPQAKLIRRHENDRDSSRRLRIGYVSPDFTEHPVGRFILSLLASHDHDRFEVFCYANAFYADDLTAQCRSHSDAWQDICGKSDTETAELIRSDQIDILVDLALHTRGNRLMVFAQKPAPVQVTFAGYPGSTGLETIDYRLTDPYLDPPGSGDENYRETSVRLADTFWCDQFVSDEPQVRELPASTNGYVTFGSLNNFCKNNPGMTAIWATILSAVKDSRLVLLAAEGKFRNRMLSEFNARGIETGRISFVTSQSRDAYLQTYNRIDIGLDTWPYGGHSTSFDALWMGVPQVTLVGRTVVGRAGVSLLSNLGLAELIAQSPEEYVGIAVDLAKDKTRLAELRGSLRSRMRQSPLTDGPRFARSVESAYRQMWKTYCADAVK